MAQDETLTQKQTQAIELLIGGRKIGEVAKEVSVGRTTLWRWMNQNYNFRAEMNRRRNALRESLADRLHALAGQALVTVEDAVGQGDLAVALKILRGCGLLDGRWPIQNENASDLCLADAFRSIAESPSVD